MQGKQPGLVFFSPPLTDVGEKQMRYIQRTKRVETQETAAEIDLNHCTFAGIVFT